MAAVRAELRRGKRQIGTVTLKRGELDYEISDPADDEQVRRVFDETGEITYAWAGRAGEEMKPSTAEPGSRAWFGAILLQILPERGYQWTTVELGDEG